MTISHHPAVFLDRDGTIIEDRGYLSKADQVVFFPETFDALRTLQEQFLLFIVTNQGGVSEGIITPSQVEAVNAHVSAELAAAGIRLTATYVGPHARSEGCACIKPQPFFLLEAARQHNVDLSRSFTVGDHPHDVELADRAGAHMGIFVLTGHGEKHRHELPLNAPLASDIGQAARLIAEQAAQAHGDC